MRGLFMKVINNMIIFTLFLLFMIGCVDSGEEVLEDRLSGIYYLNGPRFSVEEPCIHCAADEDTLREIVSFSVIAQLDHDNPDRIQFFGLLGADTGDMDKRVFPDCTRSEDCEIYGRIISGGDFEIDIENNGHRYHATGFLSTSIIYLQGQYSYEDITIDYDLSGERVFLTLD